jgi:hypothetical protein
LIDQQCAAKSNKEAKKGPSDHNGNQYYQSYDCKNGTEAEDCAAYGEKRHKTKRTYEDGNKQTEITAFTLEQKCRNRLPTFCHYW